MDDDSVPRTLVITNDFPPRIGGVQQYVWRLVAQLPPDRVSVLAPAWPGCRDHDAAQSFPVERWPATFLWPTEDLERRVRLLADEHRADAVLFGHGFPLPWLAPGLAAAGIPSVALTHGAEVWIARTPGLAAAQRRGLHACREVTAVSAYTGRLIQGAIGERPSVTVLYPGVDTERYAPTVDGRVIRERYGLGDRPLIVCVSRLVPRKGQDVLIEALETVRGLVPEATLLLVGDGPERRALAGAAATAPAGAVVFAGEAAWEELPAFYAAADVFAMPCRSRFGGLEVEGLGIVFLEAAACGKPVVAGRSGGTPEAIVDETTGLLVEGGEPKAVALAIARLLLEPQRAKRMGAAGRARVEAEFTWERSAATLAQVLQRAVGAAVG
jgi:phosphatidylinositol alpha-1,6-mannosyltransferase